jgi:hypothetical protein
MLRTLARSGEEMTVEMAAGSLTVAQPVAPGEKPPDLTPLARVVSAAGLELSAEVSESRLVSTLVWLGGR